MVFLLTFLVFTKGALADRDGPKKLIHRGKGVIEKGTTILEDVKEVQREVTDKVSGAAGTIKSAKSDINNAKSQANSVKNQVNSNVNAAKGVAGAKNLDDLQSSAAQFDDSTPSMKSPSFMTDVNNMDLTIKELDKHNYPAYGQGNDVDVYKLQNEKRYVQLREIVANMYAYAFVTRTALEAQEPKEKTQEDYRKILQDIRDQALETSERMARIVAMETLLSEYKMINEARSGKKYEEE